MQTLQFWNSIKECGLPALVHTYGSSAYSEEVLLVDEDGDRITGCLYSDARTEDVKVIWWTGGSGYYPIPTFTHWAYIPAVPKKEKE